MKTTLCPLSCLLLAAFLQPSRGTLSVSCTSLSPHLPPSLLLQLLPYFSLNQRLPRSCPHVPHLPLANIMNHFCSSSHSLAPDLSHQHKPHSIWSLHQTEPKLLNLEIPFRAVNSHLHTTQFQQLSPLPAQLAIPGPAEDQQCTLCPITHTLCAYMEGRDLEH